MINLSTGTLMLALKSVQREQRRLEALIESGTLTDQVEEYHGQYVMDLIKARSELGSAYEEARTACPDLPALDDLMKTE